jgi:hypothetical protein
VLVVQREILTSHWRREWRNAFCPHFLALITMFSIDFFSFCYLEKRLVASFTQNWDQPPFWRLIKSIFSEKKEEKKIEITYFIYYKNEMRAGSFGPSYFQMMISFFFSGGR